MADPVKMVFLPERHAHAVAEALGIALLNAVDEDGRACPIPLREEVARGDVRMMGAILNMAAISNFVVAFRPDTTE